MSEKLKKTRENQWAEERTYNEVIDQFATEMGSKPRVREIYLTGSAIDRKDTPYDFGHDVDFQLVVDTPPSYNEPIPRRFDGIVHVCQNNQEYPIQKHLRHYCGDRFEKLK